MNFKTLGYIIASVAAIGMLAVFLTMTKRTQADRKDAKTAKHDKPFSFWGHIEDKARAARGGDEAAIRDLADQVLSETRLSLPEQIKGIVHERIVQAELSYRRGENKPVRERDIARAINELAKELKLPDYAKTSPEQVRFLRFHMMPEIPSILAEGLSAEQAKTEGRKSVGD